MLSSSIELQARGDENERCSQLAQYRSIRVPRGVEKYDMNKTPEMERVKKIVLSKFGRIQAAEDEIGNLMFNLYVHTLIHSICCYFR